MKITSTLFKKATAQEIFMTISEKEKKKKLNSLKKKDTKKDFLKIREKARNFFSKFEGKTKVQPSEDNNG